MEPLPLVSPIPVGGGADVALESPKKLALVGLHGSGKTSYLAALWAIVEEGLVEGALGLHAVPNNSAYLSKISADWLRCKPPEHTPTEGLQHVELDLSDGSGRVLTMTAPDLSGETYRDLFASREMPNYLVDLLDGVAGLLLVVHPDNQGEGRPIDDLDVELEDLDIPEDEDTSNQDHDVPADTNAASGASEAQSPSDEEEDHEQATAIEFTRDSVVAQVKVVDILQAISYHIEQPAKIVVLLSAWDLVEGLGQSPPAWLAASLPLLAQYLDGLDHVVVFGLSAQGGEFKGASAQELKQLAPVERPRVVSEDGAISNDLTLPLRWLLEGEP